ncbi:class I SAM-dependent methyltransferase [Oscillochloris sp. ZM17-4]|uniref:methyltransferase domain-containing protein n=1 Tax=Oscillochloris sp. ZM17-4 TaxID=2866714 RepID=UPI001C72DD23|nr:class I SAM-dependent methyltransferase [Oscillochloris sp. ZM17-4]MBX0326262.1 class I SAM-dependent methyltransferase [Oscillochloris sp. ZM17-4]
MEISPALSDPLDLVGRAELLDELDLLLAGYGSPPDDLRRRAEALRARAEVIDAALADDLRARILAGSLGPAALRAELRRYASDPAEGGRDADDQYDSLDLLIGRALGIAAPAGEIADLPAGMVAYQPTPARWLLDLPERAGITAQDTFVDIGAGLGQVAILVSLLSGARAVGVEIQPAYVAVARRSADLLGLGRVRFRAEDALSADLGAGTVFYLYTPFVGGWLVQMLARLRREAQFSPIRVCAYGPCVPAVLAETWLRQRARCGPIYVLTS